MLFQDHGGLHGPGHDDDYDQRTADLAAEQREEFEYIASQIAPTLPAMFHAESMDPVDRERLVIRVLTAVGDVKWPGDLA